MTIRSSAALAYWQQAGVSFMVFTDDEGASEATGLIITLSDDGNVLQYVAEDITIPAATCDWNITKNDASGAAGSFTCNDQAGFGTRRSVRPTWISAARSRPPPRAEIGPPRAGRQVPCCQEAA